MIIGIDFDNVLADYSGMMCSIVRQMKGWEHPTPDQHDWGFTEWGISEDEFKAYHTLMIETERNRNLNFKGNSLEKIGLLSFLYSTLKAKGHKICILTARGSWSYFSGPESKGKVIKDTIDWLSRHEIHYDDICFVDDKTMVHCDLYIDDSPSQIRALKAAGKEVLIFSYHYNKDIEGERISSWSEDKKLELLIQKLEAKKAAN